MTYGEWKALGFAIGWSIYKDDWTKRNDQHIDDWELDFDVPDVEDGNYDVVYRYNQDRQEERCKGVIVKDGKFVPFMTAMAIYNVMVPHFSNRDGSPMQFGEPFEFRVVEQMLWRGDHFEIIDGS